MVRHSMDKGGTFAITDRNGGQVSTLRAALGWDPATAQPDTKGRGGLLGSALRGARKALQGPPKSDLDNNVAFLSGRDVVRLANGNNQYPWQVSEDNFGPVRASKDSVGGEGFGPDEWTDMDLFNLPGSINAFVNVASTFDDGNFSTARNVTGSLWNVINPGTPQEQLVPVGDEFYPKISDPTLNVSICGVGRRGDNGLWQYTQVKFQGHVQPSNDVNTANARIMAFVDEHLTELLRVTA